MLDLFAQQVPDPATSWAPVAVLTVIAVAFAVGTVVMSTLIGPGRTGPGKASTYESGMVPIGDARRRFNVRFYLMAMIFLVFDVEIVFFYPWASIFPWAVAGKYPGVSSTLLLVEIVIFVALLLVAYLYAWGKGIFRWD